MDPRDRRNFATVPIAPQHSAAGNDASFSTRDLRTPSPADSYSKWRGGLDGVADRLGSATRTGTHLPLRLAAANGRTNCAHSSLVQPSSLDRLRAPPL